MCADLRYVNQLIKANAYPTPCLEECIDVQDTSPNWTYLRVIYAIPLTEKAKSILAIVSPDSLDQCLVMPFGLKTAPSAFQRMLNHVLAERENVSIYLDDVVLATNTWDEHLTGLRQIFRYSKN